MTLPSFHVSEENNENLLILIVDKKNVFGKEIAHHISSGITTVLVSETPPTSTDTHITVSYTKTIPEIPEGNYSHMLFVWDGKKETLHILEPLLQKAAADNAQFVFITDYHFFIPHLAAYIHQQYAKASILLTGDVFGNAVYHSAVTTFFSEAREKGSIRLENVGLTHIYPVLFSDVINEILRVAFGNNKGKLLLAAKLYGMTELSFAHTLQQVDPLLKIDFTKETKAPIKMPEGEYLFGAGYDIARKLQDSYTDFTVGKKEKEDASSPRFFFSPALVQKEKISEKRNKNRWKYGIVFLLFLVVLPALFTCVYGGLGVLMLYACQNAIAKGEYVDASNFASTGKNLFSVATSANALTKEELFFPPLVSIPAKVATYLQEGSVLVSLLADGSQAAGSFSLVARGTTLTPTADFLSAVNSVKNALLTVNMFPSVTVEGIALAQVRDSLQPLSSVLDISPSLFGFPTKKTYLVLLQNNAELRPGGGFIGSYGLLTLQLGKVVDFSIHNVYDADGQLQGHIEPPYVLRRYIPQQHWFLRDSNFDVDFSTDAANAAVFLKEETGQKVDGVIGVDLTVVKDILSGIGPMYVARYNQTVTADNFFLLTEKHAEKNSFAGSTQKQDFLSALFSAMGQKLATSHGFSSRALFPLFLAIKNKDVVFGFSDPLVQDVFTVNGLSSTLWDGRIPSQGVIQDITGINEANIGVNKANYFVTRTVAQHMAIDSSGMTSGRILLTYANASTPGKWPGGDYKNYLRIILPAKTVITTISIDGKPQTIIPAVTDASTYEAKGFVAPQGLEVDSAVEEGKQLYGFVVSVPASKTKDIEISYTLGQKLDMSKPTITYNSWLFKQSGVDPYPYAFDIQVPQNFSLLSKPNDASIHGNSISYTKSLRGDAAATFVFSQK